MSELFQLVRELKMLLDEGIITQEEFQQRKTQILDQATGVLLKPLISNPAPVVGEPFPEVVGTPGFFC